MLRFSGRLTPRTVPPSPTGRRSAAPAAKRLR